MGRHDTKEQAQPQGEVAVRVAGHGVPGGRSVDGSDAGGVVDGQLGRLPGRPGTEIA
ncbi:hypothetical protein J2X68_007874 [Streptomyces sp. 3330]|uniref:hypothetical protein n=1 Tax=Streptomyces sp. 3330 TaxID=2817755 RepID=UPI002864CB49|nr:hypothetical protein [Streptomyces sp. 3330]MDR6981132.1 hypothetical protein [Streptomyces sp. 3330]